MYQKWIKIGLEKGLTDIEIHANSKTNLSIEVYDGKVKSNEISDIKNMVVKGIYDNKEAMIKIENLSDENINKMLDYLVENLKNITATEPSLIFEGSKKYPQVNEEIFDFKSIDPTKKVELLLEIENKIAKNKKVSKVETAAYSESLNENIIVNSKGLNLSRKYAYATIYAVGIYQEEGQIKTGLSYQVVKDFNKISAKKIIRENIKNGSEKLGSKSIASKSYPVVFSNEMFGNILASFLHIFTGDAAFKKQSKLIGKENEKIASPIVNLIDDPLNSKALFKVPFDDEGVACKKKHLIKDGKFNGFIHNLKTAAIFKTKPTGNGFGSSVDAANLYLKPENKTFNQLIEDIESGIYITELVGLHAGIDSISGDFSLQAAGFEIKEGKILRPVDMIVVSGNFFDLLNDIEGIAKDFIFGLSGIGSGSVRVKKLTIAGQ